MAQAKTAARKPRRKEKKNIALGQAHIKSTFNNTIVSITDPSGAVISWASSGGVGFKGSRKSTPVRRRHGRRVGRPPGAGARRQEGRRLREGPGLGPRDRDPFAPGRWPRGRLDQRCDAPGSQRLPSARSAAASDLSDAAATGSETDRSSSGRRSGHRHVGCRGRDGIPEKNSTHLTHCKCHIAGT